MRALFSVALIASFNAFQ